MGADNQITLFVMQGCHICPQMVRLFESLRGSGKIQTLEVLDVSEHPELAETYHIRAAPHYLINGVGFSGLRTAGEIEKLLAQGEQDNWAENISAALRGGDLSTALALVRDHRAARQAMPALLRSTQTELVVRIGLTVIIEELAETNLLHEFDRAFIDLVGSSDERIALDALYYLQLLATPACITRLQDIDRNGGEGVLAREARELLAEMTASVQ